MKNPERTACRPFVARLKRWAVLALAAPTLAAAQAGAQGTATASAAPSGFVQVPGVYRQLIDGLQVTALFDGVIFMPVEALRNIGQAGAQARLSADDVPQTPKGVQTAVNAYLVRRGPAWLLVDTGAATCFGPTLGKVLDNLRAAGGQPEQVNDILLTHAHPDHVCGLLTAEGQPAYPNATVWLSRADADHWLDTAARERAPQAMRGLFDMVRRALAPYQAAGHFKAFGAGDALPAGVEALPSPGHTPGHTSWRITGLTGQDSLLVWGDIVHSHAVQFRRPETAVEYDSNRPQAIASRRRLFALADKQQGWVAGAHLPFPGIGHVRRAGTQTPASYRWVPVEFGPVSKP